MLSRLGERYVDVLTDHHRIVRQHLATHGGREVDTAGDGCFAVFGTPRACVEAVIGMQRELAAQPWPDGETVRVRMGVHTGEASVEAVGIVGMDVHKAARIASAANGGQVLVSHATATLVQDHLADGVALRSLGPHRLKDLATPQELFQLEAAGLAIEFPPIRTLDNPELRHNLPTQLSSFVGRVEELASVEQLVRDERLVTLTGSGGCGKTRLALQVAAELLDGSADGVWFVDLAPLTDEAFVGSEVASALRLRVDSSQPVTEQLVEALSGRELLLVLDNCEHVIDACAKLADALLRSCGRLHLLATSREPLGLDGEHVFRVPSLSLPSDGDVTSALSSEAVQLFYDRAKAHQPGFVLDEASLATVTSICARLDGVPLAIELATARLRSLSPADVERRLGDRFRLLTGGGRAALPRQQTLRATIDWSYDALNERDQAVLDVLSVFAGGFDLTAAEAMCASSRAEGFEVLDAVTSLVDKSLVQADTTQADVRFGLLETIREYALERLVASGGREAALRRHAEHWATFAERSEGLLRGPTQLAALDRLEADHENLRAALAWSLAPEPAASTDRGRGELGLRLVHSLGSFWYLHGHAAEGRRWLDRAISVATEDGGEQLAQIAHNFGVLLDQQGEAGVAREMFERSLQLARDLGDRRGVARELNSLGIVHRHLGDPAAARALLEESIALSRELDDENRLAAALENLAQLESAAGRFDHAVELLEEALVLEERAGDRFGMAVAQHSLSLLELRRGRPRQAFGALLRTFGFARDSGNSAFLYNSLELAAVIVARLVDAPRAARLLGAAEAVRGLTGDEMAPSEAALLDEFLAPARQAVSEQVWDDALAAGRSCTEAAALELLLSLEDGSEPGA